MDKTFEELAQTPPKFGFSYRGVCGGLRDVTGRGGPVENVNLLH